MSKRTIISSTELAGGRHKICLERDNDTRYLIHMCNNETVQNLEYDALTEVEESFRDYKLIVQTIQSVIKEYGLK